MESPQHPPNLAAVARGQTYLTLKDVSLELRSSVEFVRQRCIHGQLRSVVVNHKHGEPEPEKKDRRVTREWLDDYKRSLASGMSVRQESTTAPVGAAAGGARKWNYDRATAKAAARGRSRR